jgi:hypothetical protein
MMSQSVEPVNFIVTPEKRTLADLAHVHLGGVCIKNRFGQKCPEESA